MSEGKALNYVAPIASADADATFGAPEAVLVNEMKDQINALLAELRARGWMDKA